VALRIDFTRPETRQLHEVLVTQYWGAQQLVTLVQQADYSPADVHFHESMRDTWQATLIAVDRALKLVPLLEAVLQDRRAADIHATVREFLTAEPAMPVPAERPRLRAVSDDAEAVTTFEKVMGSVPTFLDVSFLRTGVEASRAVCKLVVTFVDATNHPHRCIGTGFLIAPQHVLTNHHVLVDESHRLSRVEAIFDYESSQGGASLEPKSVDAVLDSVCAEADGDWGSFDLEAPISDRIPLKFASKPAEVEDWIAIIQHPNGLPKKVAVHHNIVTYADADIVQYIVDTDLGSSGSPVFNHDWEVVALHHAGGDRPVPGTSVRAYRNEGIPIAKVKARLEARKMTFGH